MTVLRANPELPALREIKELALCRVEEASGLSIFCEKYGAARSFASWGQVDNALKEIALAWQAAKQIPSPKGEEYLAVCHCLKAIIYTGANSHQQAENESLAALRLALDLKDNQYAYKRWSSPVQVFVAQGAWKTKNEAAIQEFVSNLDIPQCISQNPRAAGVMEEIEANHLMKEGKYEEAAKLFKAMADAAMSSGDTVEAAHALEKHSQLTKQLGNLVVAIQSAQLSVKLLQNVESNYEHPTEDVSNISTLGFAHCWTASAIIQALPDDGEDESKTIPIQRELTGQGRRSVLLKIYQTLHFEQNAIPFRSELAGSREASFQGEQSLIYAGLLRGEMSLNDVIREELLKGCQAHVKAMKLELELPVGGFQYLAIHRQELRAADFVLLQHFITSDFDGLSDSEQRERVKTAMLFAERSRGIVLMAQLQKKLSPVYASSDDELWSRMRKAAACWGKNSVVIQYSIISDEMMIIYVLKANEDFPQALFLKYEGRTEDNPLHFRKIVQHVSDGHPYMLQYLQQLQSSLVQPIEDELGELPEESLLIFIPDKEIALVPFGLLVNPKRYAQSPLGPGAKRLEHITPEIYSSAKLFLFQQHSFVSAPTICCIEWAESAWQKVLARQGDGKVESEVLLVTDPGSINKQGIEDALPFSRDMADEVQATLMQYLVVKSLKGGVPGLEATREHVKEQMPRHDWLHFSLHALKEGTLLLRGPESEGALKAAEIAGMDIGAAAVMLSCCSTGHGPLTGDGILGLSRAFMCANCAAVVQSLWDLRQATAPLVDRLLYFNLLEGKNLQEALQSSMLEMGSQMFRSPVKVPEKMTLKQAKQLQQLRIWKINWAGLMLVGSPNARLYSPSKEEREIIAAEKGELLGEMSEFIQNILTSAFDNG